MNTTFVGDEFEERCHNAIVIAINEGMLGITPDSARVFKKKKYYSAKRDKDIIIDIAIEVWPPNAERASVIYLIECKNYSKKIPVDDIEEFWSKINQISDNRFFLKGVFIASSSFQEGALTLGKNLGFMMVELDDSDKLDVKFHKRERNPKNQSIPFEETDKKVEAFFRKIFDLKQGENISKLSRINIANTANLLLNDFDSKILSTGRKISIDKLILFFEKKYDVKFNLNAPLDDRLLGYYDSYTNEIQINSKLSQTNRQAFTIAHEMGHYILHKNLKVDQSYYDSFSDSIYDFNTDRYILENFRHWVEWQANYFAASLLMPKTVFIYHLIKFQTREGISKQGRIYLDDQRVNIEDYLNAISYLSDHFNTTKTSTIYRLEEYNIIVYANYKRSVRAHLRGLLFQLDDDYSGVREKILNEYGDAQSVDNIINQILS